MIKEIHRKSNGILKRNEFTGKYDKRAKMLP